MKSLAMVHHDEYGADLAAAVERGLQGADAEGVEWRGVGVPEHLGGAGGELIDLAVVLEAAGAALAPGSLTWTSGVVTQLLCTAPEPPEDLVRSFVTGESSASVPAAAGARAPEMEVTAERTLRGSMLVLGRPDSHLATVIEVDGEAELVVVPPHLPGVTVQEASGLDVSRPIATISLDVPLGEVHRVQVERVKSRWEALTRLVFALDSLGVARHALERTIEYSLTRAQFGQVIGSFQAYKHRCADSFIELKLAQAVVQRAVRAFASATDDHLTTAAAAHAVGTLTAICGRAVQLHGGIGYTWEAGLHRNLRRARLNEVLADASGARESLAVWGSKLIQETAPT